MKFPTKLLNIFHHNLSMFLHYLGKVNSLNLQYEDACAIRQLHYQ